MSAEPALPSPLIASGVCHVAFASDLGFAIDLERAVALLPGRSGRTQIRERRTPSHLVIEPAPLRAVEPAEPCRVGRWTIEPEVEYTLFDFGGAILTYRIPLEGPLADLAELSALLYENREVARHALGHLGELVSRVRDAVLRPDPAPLLEDYAIFQVERFAAPVATSGLLRDHAALLAAILRGEPGPLSPQEIAEATAQASSYRPDDLLIVDWNAAFAVDDDVDAIVTVLLFANVELAELRAIDGRLDAVLNRAYETVARRSIRDAIGIGPDRIELPRLARLQMDAAIVFEQVNNALKLFGDEYLARVYRLAARRLHTADWDASILRKLQTVDQIYSKLADRQATRRMELLEWVIILLIAWEVIWTLLG